MEGAAEGARSRQTGRRRGAPAQRRQLGADLVQPEIGEGGQLDLDLLEAALVAKVVGLERGCRNLGEVGRAVVALHEAGVVGRLAQVEEERGGRLARERARGAREPRLREQRRVEALLLGVHAHL